MFALLAVSLAAPAPAPAPAPKPQFLAAAPYAYPGYAAYTAPYVVSPYSLGYSGLGKSTYNPTSTLVILLSFQHMDMPIHTHSFRDRICLVTQ